MSVCGQTEEESGSEEPPAGAPLRDMYEQKAASKVVRVLTVLAYLLSVSLAAILLSVYYVCVWQAQPPGNDTDETGPSALMAPYDYSTGPPDFSHQTSTTGGGNSSVSEAMTAPPADLTSFPTVSEIPDPDYDNTTLDIVNSTSTVPNFTLNATDQR